MAFSENEGRQVRTFRVSFREMTRIFADLGGFNLGWHWLYAIKTKDTRLGVFCFYGADYG